MTKGRPDELDIITMIVESNKIEDEFSVVALEDAIAAWEWGKIEMMNNGNNVTNKLIFGLHEMLMSRLNKEIAGEQRKCVVYVDRRECPQPQEISTLLTEWISEYGDIGSWSMRDDDDKIGAKEEIKTGHIEFEKIHPFADGNGRVGRLIMALQLHVLNLPIFIIEASERGSYYQWFKEDKDKDKDAEVVTMFEGILEQRYDDMFGAEKGQEK